MRLFLWFSKTLLLIFLPFRTWTLICLASEFDGIHWKTPLWDLFTRWISSELTVTPGRQFWLKTSLTLAASFRSSPFAGWDSDTSTNWNNKKMDFFIYISVGQQHMRMCRFCFRILQGIALSSHCVKSHIFVQKLNYDEILQVILFEFCAKIQQYSWILDSKMHQILEL